METLLNHTEMALLSLDLPQDATEFNTTPSNMGNLRPRSASPTTTSAARGHAESYYWRVGLFGVGGTVICCVGIVCNIIAIIVLSRLRNKSSAPCLLMCLSGLDCIYLLAFLFLETLTILSSGGLITSDYRPFIAPAYRYLYALPLICQTCTAYVVVTITLERFVVIVLPFRAHAVCSLKWAISTVLCVVCASILYHIPDYLAFHHVKRFNRLTQTHVHRFERTVFGRGHFYTEIYFTWMNLTVNFLVPFALILTFNFTTVFSIYHSFVVKEIDQPQASLSTKARHGQQKRLTVMIIAMTSIFFLCELMAAIAFIFTARLVGYHDATIHVNRLSALADTLMLLKSAVNFLVYCATGSKFRAAFCELFCPCRRPSGAGKASTRSRAVCEATRGEGAGCRRVLTSSHSCSSVGTRSLALASVASSQSHAVGNSADVTAKAERSYSAASAGTSGGDGGQHSRRVGSSSCNRHGKCRLSFPLRNAESQGENCFQRSGDCADDDDRLLEVQPAEHKTSPCQASKGHADATELVALVNHSREISDRFTGQNYLTERNPLARGDTDRQETELSELATEDCRLETLENSHLLAYQNTDKSVEHTQSGVYTTRPVSDDPCQNKQLKRLDQHHTRDHPVTVVRARPGGYSALARQNNIDLSSERVQCHSNTRESLHHTESSESRELEDNVFTG